MAGLFLLFAVYVKIRLIFAVYVKALPTMYIVYDRAFCCSLCMSEPSLILAVYVKALPTM